MWEGREDAEVQSAERTTPKVEQDHLPAHQKHHPPTQLPNKGQIQLEGLGFGRMLLKVWAELQDVGKDCFPRTSPR